MNKWVLAIDQGTTGTTAVLVNRSMEICHKETHNFEQIYPRPGYVEHRAEDILRSVEKSVLTVLSKGQVKPGEISCIGVTNQRETTGIFGKDGSVPHNFIVWQCKRTQEICKSLRDRGLEEKIRMKTGLVVDPYFSATKLIWLLKNINGASDCAKRGELLFGTIDSFLLHRLTGGKVHATDVSNASRTMLMNLSTLNWDEDLLDCFQIPKACLPTILPSSGHFGFTKGVSFLEDGIPICGLAGDQQAALFGQTCFEAGDAKITLGTGSFLLMNTGRKPLFSNHGLLTSIAYQINNEVNYCLEGSAFVAGAAVQWLRDGLGVIKESGDIEELALRVPDSGEVDFVPALAGLGAPYWRPEGRGLITGVSRGTNLAHLARATLEGIALQNFDLIEAMQKDGVQLKSLKMDGGASKNNLLLQYHADYLGVPCLRPQFEESTSLGVAALAGLAAGFFPNIDYLKESWKSKETFVPKMEQSQLERRIARWRTAVLKA